MASVGNLTIFVGKALGDTLHPRCSLLHNSSLLLSLNSSSAFADGSSLPVLCWPEAHPLGN